MQETFDKIKRSTGIILGDIKGLILKPVPSLKNLRKRTPMETLLYSAIIIFIYSFGFAITTFYNLDTLRSFSFLAGFGLIEIFLIIYAIIWGSLIINTLFLQIFVIIVEGKRGLFETLKVIVYGGTPTYIFGWIPIIGLLTGLWALILEILAIRELHEISTGRAVIAMIMPYIIFLCLFISFTLMPAPVPLDEFLTLNLP
ncbi:YIP1 family protein [Methanochimaera problematica]|nr:YIP1 family protein [Methanoplanus sp. FWC-SCC4]